MPQLPRRLRRPRAQLQLELQNETPPELASGGVAHVGVILLPGESFTINRGWLELSLITTRFARTVLDGYHEHSTEKLFRTVELCGHSEARSGGKLEWSANVPLPSESPPEARPTRLRWKVRARFDVKGCREIRAARLLRSAGTTGLSEPVVDGTGFLPL